MDFQRLTLILLLLSAFMPASASTPERFALVIGNADYTSAPLANPVNDARDMAAKLTQRGFRVTRLLNATHRQMEEAVQAFTKQLGGEGAVGLFYFAGHGIEIRGQNYLLPVDADIRTEADVRWETLNAGKLLDKMATAENGVNLVILDACRDNPFSRSFRSLSRGLADMNPAQGTLVFYATQPRNTAADGDGGNGTFTKHLLRVMDKPGVEVKSAFHQVAMAVNEETKAAQTPWTEGMILGLFYFIPPQQGPDQPELLLWQSMQGCGTAACYQAYLDAYPKGRFTAGAQALIAKLRPSPPVLPKLSPKPDPMAALNQQLTLCRRHLDANRLTTGTGGTALDCYQDILKQQPGNTQALDGLDAISAKYLGWAESNLKRKRYQKAAGYLAKAEAILPESPRLAALQERLQAAQMPVGAASAAQPAAITSKPKTTTQPAASKIQPGRSWREPVTGMEFVGIPKGCFKMGSNNGDSDEKPVHEVCLDAFGIGKYEVTFDEWDACVRDGGCTHKPGDGGWGRGKRPVIAVSWKHAQEYVKWMSRKTGERYRLPSEAEWEYAARAGTQTKYWWGDQPPVCRKGARNGAKFDDNKVCNNTGTEAIGSYTASPWGLYDVHGNVWEWTEDCWNGSYKNAPTDGSAWQQGRCEQRVLRGGSWGSFPRFLRSAVRLWIDPGIRDYLVGFRVARALTP
jgi:formylglycine-generating enzyme required for sulfatase activity